MIGDLYLSYARYRDILKMRDSNSLNYAAPSFLPPTLLGVPVHQSTAFPFEVECRACDSSGEGQDSTYCDRCSGAGKQRFAGVMVNGGQTILLTEKLPKAFEPSFPAGLVPPAPLCRGLA